MIIRLFKNYKVMYTVLPVLIAGSLFAIPVMRQDVSPTEINLHAIADGVLKSATFQFVDQKSGQHFRATGDAPTDSQLRPESPYSDWRYWNGVLNIAMLRLGDAVHESSYAAFTRRNIAFSFDNVKYFKEHYKNEGKWNYPFGQQFIMEELDDCGAMGASVIEVDKHDTQDRYAKYIDSAAHHIMNLQGRLADGTLVRSSPRKWTIWADDLYMSISFLSRMGKRSGDSRYYDDAAKQVIAFHKYLFNNENGLMYHCWYSDVRESGVAFWGRANGWAILAQVDLLDHLPKDHPQRGELIKLLRRHILGIARYQGSDGLWHQLLDKPDSYLETSCSAMFTYGVSRAVNMGYIEPSNTSIAIKGWEGIMTKIHADGQIEGICEGTGVGNDLVFYYKRPTPLNDVHGIGAVILAGIEVLSLKQ